MMLSSCWIPFLLHLFLHLLLLLPAVTEAQSGDGDSDAEPRISCISHIMTTESSLTCKLLGSRIEDDEDDDDIEKMTLCYTDWSSGSRREECMEVSGDSVTSRDLSPVVPLNVTLQLKGGGRMSKMIDLQKIVKPRCPQVWNITFSQESNQTLINIRTPYHKEYLKVENQLFQLQIWNTGVPMIQNVSGSEHVVMKIGMQQLQKNTQYHVRVRAIPQVDLQGTWSEWSQTVSFVTPAEKERVEKQTEDWLETHTLIMCLVLLAFMTFSVVFFWKNKIFTYMWPSIPHPKHTLVQICKPNKGLLLNLKPEVFSALKFDPMETTEALPSDESQPSITAAAEGTESNAPSSIQSSDCSRSTTSVSTEELELSALLSRSSSDGESSLQSASSSPINLLQQGETPDTPQPERSSGGHEAAVFGVSQQDEAYVTMSSFYQIK